jgi:hypothetical protein
MLTDYKIWYIKRDDNNFIIEVAIRYFEGSITTLSEKVGFDSHIEQVSRYRRSKRLMKSDLPHFKNEKFGKEENGNDAVIYFPINFGSIKTDDELHSFLRKQIAKDTTRTIINEQ